MCIGLIHNMASVLAGLPPAMQVKVSHKLLSLTTFTSYLDIMQHVTTLQLNLSHSSWKQSNFGNVTTNVTV